MNLDNAADLFSCSCDDGMPLCLQLMPVADAARPDIVAEIYCAGCESTAETIRTSDDADIVLDAIGCACADHEDCEY